MSLRCSRGFFIYIFGSSSPAPKMNSYTMRHGEILYVQLNNAMFIYTEQKKLRKSQKTMQHKDTKANNYLIFIYLFRYISSVEKNADFSLLAPIPLL